MVNQEKSKTKYQIEFVVMIVLLLLGIVCLSGILVGLNVPEMNWLLVFHGIPLVAAFAICVVSTIIVGRFYRIHKDEASYDEFGVRKDEKRRMELHSKERRKLEMQSLMELEKVLPRNTIEQITKEGANDPEKALNALIGLDPVKDRLLEMKARMEFDMDLKKKKKRAPEASDEGHHMVFYGPPGTGKTTVARIITGILYDYEYINQNKIVEVDGNFLKSNDPAMTETKVRFVCRAAYNGVLFIDEAYALGDDEVGHTAIATLIKEMEDHRDKLIVILAGYSEPMSKMLDVNPGFKSRVKEYLDFPNYSQPELIAIFKTMAKEKGFDVDNSCEKPLTLRFAIERDLSSWGNARTVRNVLEETIDKHALRFVKGEVEKSQKYVLFGGDISTEPKSLL